MLRWPRGELVAVVFACALGAVLVLVAARATWVVEVVERPAPLPAERTERTGADLRPLLPALGWVALAGAGALVATRGLARRVVGGLLVLAGAAVALGGGPAGGWLVLATAGGVLITGVGVVAVWRGARWLALGTRYERTRQQRARYERAGHPPASSPARADPAAPRELWEALDRGEDPTDRPS